MASRAVWEQESAKPPSPSPSPEPKHPMYIENLQHEQAGPSPVPAAKEPCISESDGTLIHVSFVWETLKATTTTTITTTTSRSDVPQCGEGRRTPINQPTFPSSLCLKHPQCRVMCPAARKKPCVCNTMLVSGVWPVYHHA